jgi:hypothetical protein
MREPVRNRGRRGRRGVLAAAAGAVAALALAAPAAVHAADDCPNAAVRAAQNGAKLPECRAYEQVSAQFKNGNLIGGHLPAVSPDGGALLYQSNSTFGDALSNLASRTVARRGADGWSSTSMVPPFTSRVPVVADIPSVVTVSPSFDSVLYATRYPLSPDDRGTSLAGGALTNIDVYQYDADGSLTWLSRMPVLPDSSELNVAFTMASADTSRVVVRTERALDPAFPDLTTLQHYLIVDKQQPRLLSVLPDGTPSTGADGLNDASTWGDEDFSRIVFKPSGVNTLYLRDHADDPAAAQTRELTFGPADASCSGRVNRLTADGRRMLVSCAGDAHPDPAAGQAQLYVADVDSGEVTRLPVMGDVVAASEDLSRIYIQSREHAVPGAGDTNLYLVRNGELSLVATYPELTDGGLSFSPAVLSADGDQIAFASDLPLGFASGGLAQIYRYDATVGAASLSCISCRPDGATTTEIGSISPLTLTGAAVAGTMSSDGRRVIFTTRSRLVPDDTNGVLDAYLWLDGELHLISSGRSPINSYASGASADGAEVYFTTAESLVPQDIDNGVADLYAATVGGGFAAAADGETSCTTDCQGPVKGLEPLPAPGTVVFSGPGDVGDVEDGSPSTVVKVFRVEGVGPKARAAWARGGRASVRVRLSHAGRATAVMRAQIGKRSVVIARASRSTAGGGTVSLPLRLSKTARAVLRREGMLRTTVRVTVPGAGGAQSASLVLRTAKAKAGRR